MEEQGLSVPPKKRWAWRRLMTFAGFTEQQFFEMGERVIMKLFMDLDHKQVERIQDVSPRFKEWIYNHQVWRKLFERDFPAIFKIAVSKKRPEDVERGLPKDEHNEWLELPSKMQLRYRKWLDQISARPKNDFTYWQRYYEYLTRFGSDGWERVDARRNVKPVPSHEHKYVRYKDDIYVEAVIPYQWASTLVIRFYKLENSREDALPRHIFDLPEPPADSGVILRAKVIAVHPNRKTFIVQIRPELGAWGTKATMVVDVRKFTLVRKNADFFFSEDGRFVLNRLPSRRGGERYQFYQAIMVDFLVNCEVCGLSRPLYVTETGPRRYFCGAKCANKVK